MKLLNRLSFCYLCVYLFFGGAIAAAQDSQNVQPLTLNDCIRLAVREDPEVIYAQDQKKIGRIEKTEAQKDLILPTLDLESTYGPKLDFFGRPVTSENIYDSKVGFEKPLYKGGELITTYRLAAKRITRSEYDYLQNFHKVMHDTTKKYYRLLFAQKILERQKELYHQAGQSVDIIKSKYKLGGALKIDVLEAETKLNDAKFNLIEAEGRWKSARTALNEKIGRKPLADIQVVEEYPIEPVSGETIALIEEALRKRPDLLYSNEDMEFNRLRVDLNKSKALPTLSLKGRYAWEGRDFPGEDKEWNLMLNLSISLFDSTLSSNVGQFNLFENEFNFIPEELDYDQENVKLSIFDGSSNAVDLENARAEYRLALNKVKKLKRQIIKEVRDAMDKVREKKALVATADKTIAYKQEKLQLLEARKRLNEASEIEILEARAELVDAQVKGLESQYESIAATADLYRAMGKKW